MAKRAPQGDPDRDEQAVASFVDRFSGVLTSAGIPRMASRVFVLLLATDSGRLTATELGEQLQSSAGAVSGAVRYLTQVGLVDREHETGSRRNHYRVREDVWYEALVRREQTLSRWDRLLHEGIEAVGAGSGAGARIGETTLFFEFMAEETPELLRRWHAYRARTRSSEADPRQGKKRQ